MGWDLYVEISLEFVEFVDISSITAQFHRNEMLFFFHLQRICVFFFVLKLTLFAFQYIDCLKTVSISERKNKKMI